MIISGDLNPNNSSRSSDDDIEDDTYIPSPRACPHGKGLASASGSGATANEEIEEEVEEEDDADDEEGEADFFMLMRSTPPPTSTWEPQPFGYPSTWIRGRKSAARAKQIW
jgi:hypothetical protein